MQVRIDEQQQEPLRSLAKANKRTIPKEVSVAIDDHLIKHRAAMRNGDKMPKKAK